MNSDAWTCGPFNRDAIGQRTVHHRVHARFVRRDAAKAGSTVSSAPVSYSGTRINAYQGLRSSESNRSGA